MVCMVENKAKSNNTNIKHIEITSIHRVSKYFLSLIKFGLNFCDAQCTLHVSYIYAVWPILPSGNPFI